LLVTNPLPSGHPAYFFRTELVPAAAPSSSVLAPTLASPARLPDRALRFELHAMPGSVWQLQGSPDIFHWGNYERVTNVSGTTPITNTPVGRPGAYFYRVLQP
jgi:hypothetical protein